MAITVNRSEIQCLSLNKALHLQSSSKARSGDGAKIERLANQRRGGPTHFAMTACHRSAGVTKETDRPLGDDRRLAL